MHTYHEPNNVNHTLKVYNIFMWIFSMASLFFNDEFILPVSLGFTSRVEAYNIYPKALLLVNQYEKVF